MNCAANVTVYDAMYVALAETLACSLLTVHAMSAAAAGPRCPIDVIAGTRATRSGPDGGPSDDEKLAAMIAGLDADDVADLLLQAALEHDDVARAVRLAAADDGDRLQVLRQAVDASLRTRRFLDYWASSRWAADAAPVVDALRQEAERQQSKELVALIERGIGHLVKVLLTPTTRTARSARSPTTSSSSTPRCATPASPTRPRWRSGWCGSRSRTRTSSSSTPSATAPRSATTDSPPTAARWPSEPTGG